MNYELRKYKKNMLRIVLIKVFDSAQTDNRVVTLSGVKCIRSTMFNHLTKYICLATNIRKFRFRK